MEDGYKQTVYGLLRKHKELLGDIAEATEALAVKQSALAAIEAAIRVFDPEHVPATEHQRRGAGTTGLYRFIAESLRKEGAVTTLGAAKALIRERGWDDRDKALATNVRKRVGDALHKMRTQGRVTGERYGNGGELRWRLS